MWTWIDFCKKRVFHYPVGAVLELRCLPHSLISPQGPTPLGGRCREFFGRNCFIGPNYPKFNFQCNGSYFGVPGVPRAEIFTKNWSIFNKSISGRSAWADKILAGNLNCFNWDRDLCHSTPNMINKGRLIMSNGMSDLKDCDSVNNYDCWCFQ